VIFGINTTRDISKLSQISLAHAREILVNNFEIYITRGINAKYHYKHAITYTKHLKTLLTKNQTFSLNRGNGQFLDLADILTITKTI